MPTPLNESDTLSFFHEFGRVNVPLSPSGTGGAVILWQSAPPDMGVPAAVLVYQAVDGRQLLTNISDLTRQQISNLGLPALANGMWYYLPGAIIEAIGDLPENLANEGIWLADKIGQIAAAATGPILPLTPILIAAGVIIALIYLPRASG